MSQAPIPANEHERLAALRALELLDSPDEAMFDNILSLIHISEPTRPY